MTIVAPLHVTALCRWKLSAAHTGWMCIAYLVVVSSEHGQSSSTSNLGVMSEEESPDISLLDAAVQKQWDHALPTPLLVQSSIQESHVWERSVILDALVSKQTGLGKTGGSPAAACQKSTAQANPHSEPEHDLPV